MVSIIIPIYNSERFLTECLESIRNQTYKDIEVLCIDDGSTDSSANIIKRYTNTDYRFVYISQTHTNAGKARNTGIDKACGDYLLFIDSDDFIEVDLVENLIRYTNNYHADIYVFKYRLYDDLTKTTSSDIFGYREGLMSNFVLSDIEKNTFEFTNISVWNKMYKSNFIRRNGIRFMTMHAINDLYFSWRALLSAESIVLCNTIGTYYRINSGLSISDDIKRLSSCFIEAFMEINNYAKEIGRWEALKYELILAEKHQIQEYLERMKHTHDKSLKLNQKQIDVFLSQVYNCWKD